MSIENIKKLELGIDKICHHEKKYLPMTEATREMMQPLIDEGLRLKEEAIKSGEMDILSRTFDYFLEETPDNGLGNGVCESLERAIFEYFSWEQIFLVLKIKFIKLDSAVKLI